jgi:hypothetical protein
LDTEMLYIKIIVLFCIATTVRIFYNNFKV